MILWGEDLSAVGQGESKRRIVVRVSAFRFCASVSELSVWVFNKKMGDDYMFYMFSYYMYVMVFPRLSVMVFQRAACRW